MAPVTAAPCEEPSVKRRQEGQEGRQGKKRPRGGSEMRPLRARADHVEDGNEQQENKRPVEQKNVKPPQELPEVAMLATVGRNLAKEEQEAEPDQQRRNCSRKPASARSRVVGILNHWNFAWRRGGTGPRWDTAIGGGKPTSGSLGLARRAIFAQFGPFSKAVIP
jgi:hypothetical protein